MPRKPAKQTTDVPMDFNALVDAIEQVHQQCAAVANSVVNTSLTLRNWVIGTYIREYEQQGADRASYGEALLERLASRFSALSLKGFSARYLRGCRQFSSVYPEIWRSLTAKSAMTMFSDSIRRSLTAEFPSRENSNSEQNDQNPIVRSVKALFETPNRLFVSKYQLELPSWETLQKFIDTKHKEVSGEV